MKVPITFFEGLACRGQIVAEIRAACVLHGVDFEYEPTGGWLRRWYAGTLSGDAEAIRRVGQDVAYLDTDRG